MFAALLVAAAVWLNGSLGGAMATPDVIGAIVALLLVGATSIRCWKWPATADARRARTARRDPRVVRRPAAARDGRAPGAGRRRHRAARLHLLRARRAAEVLRGIDLRIAPGQSA